MARAGYLAGRRTRSARAAGALTLVGALALAACGGGDGGDTTADGESKDLECSSESVADEQWKAAEPREFSLLWTDWADYPITDTWEFFDEVEKRTNVKLKLTNIPFSDATEKRSLLISAGDAPQIIPLVYTGEERQFAASGAVVPLSDYADYMPNFKKYTEEWDLVDMVDDLRQEDGKYYMTPGLQEVSVPTFTLIIRKDVFDEVGAPAPETWEDLQEGLELIKAKYPDSLPLADGFEAWSMINYAAHAFGTVGGWGFGDGAWWDEDAGEFVYAATTDGYKDMVTYFRGLYDAGLLDGESFTAANDGGGTVVEKVAAEKVFAFSGGSWTVQEFGTALEAAGVTDYELVQIAPPGGPAGDVVEPRNFWNGFMLTADAAKDENFCDLLHFTDWLYYNPEARDLIQWGVEGTHFTKEDGKYTLEPDFTLKTLNLNPSGTIDIKKDLGYANDVFAGSTESRELKESYNVPAYVQYIDDVQSKRTPRDPFPPHPLDEAELEQSSLLGTPLKDTVDTGTLEFILGQRDLSEWDSFVSQLEGQGLQNYMDLINGAYKRAAEANG
ncbi:ABC transporter substrate-binding protein [Cellulomonas xiejunii]|uniref:Extracellular solute-binding protein n=1 Tax=Cellulomonas xiejunii TaxID=2968083 RepID=A0ABY5KKD8_9CELL|nr:extracellular solute-binding protein [Cellulomonas xiejunii]MCC2315482.1 extracellular solute-binding protein [Cellulomonas xiejunii]MCC2320646.1 extracellular solute-binding protein [Cellulomonas xiejunii]UUI70936.1 extracellular solute-binding protein [Cellulomonas xiejunii]